MGKTANKIRYLLRRAGLLRGRRCLCRKLGVNKIFGVGFNKTGTLSLARAMADLGFDVAPQRPAEMMLGQWASGDFSEIVRFCEIYEFYQDAPFSFPATYAVLDRAFPGSKFILTVRDSAEQWEQSMFTYHTKQFGRYFEPFDWREVDKIDYVYPGWLAQCYEQVYGFSRQSSQYDRDLLKRCYEKHNRDVAEYFGSRKDLLVINVAEEDSYVKLCKFLGVDCSDAAKFPRMNITHEMKGKAER